MPWDVFISHAREDKAGLVEPLALLLQGHGLKVWYDDFSLKLGGSLRRSIERGLAESRFGVVVLSKHFFEKEWPQLELDGLLTREAGGEKIILPVWHNVSEADVRRHSPLLAGRKAVETSHGLSVVVYKILEVVRPDRLPPASGDWKHSLEHWKRLIYDVVNSPDFLAKYPADLPASGFVDGLCAELGKQLSPSERDALVGGMTSGTLTRAAVLRTVDNK